MEWNASQVSDACCGGDRRMFGNHSRLNEKAYLNQLRFGDG